ncbi:MAG: hypothetical protein ACLQVF_02080, partial [Isosphaeraceae bacterium]
MVPIPQRLAQLLANGQYLGALTTFNNAVAAILSDNQMPFFPGYTDHGIQHVGRVLATEVRLIPNEVWKAALIEPSDAAVMVCSTLLHDLAMHLREDGFLSLVGGCSCNNPIPWFSEQQIGLEPDKPWPLLWHAFLNAARRFSDRELTNIFGPFRADAFETRPWGARELPTDPRNWDNYDRLLIGEFLRRNHARLAHEMAFNGFPGLQCGTGPGQFPALDSILPHLADLAGLVARSHGLPLRVCTDYLASGYPGVLRPRGVAAVYHMTLLRVADYLQMDADRAPPVLLQLRNPQSPVSIDEWKKHRAIEYLSYNHKDPQAIFIELNRSHSLRTHLQIKELISGLQEEMDKSSAILDEVYGRARDEGLNRLRLTKSRVRSNLDDGHFIESLPYVPIRAGFSSDPHLLSLLVEPLYGNGPMIGIRELMQNAVDAVRELHEYCKTHNRTITNLPLRDQSSDVLIEIVEESDRWLLVVSDRGIGMQESTIQEYFLRAGASFRNSWTWNDQFTDETGHSRVLRSGRFGVGVFAAFLLGKAIRAETRHLSSKGGYSFEASKGTELVELRRTDLPVGTSITIRLNNEVVETLLEDTDAWDWYSLKWPSVERRIRRLNRKPKRLKQQFVLPGDDREVLPRGWNRITPRGFKSVLWTRHREVPALTCNGIRIAHVSGSANSGFKLDDVGYSWSNKEGTNFFIEPHLAVFDPDGNLPLSLTRDSLMSDRVPFEEELYADLVNNMIAYCVLHAPDKPIWKEPKLSTRYMLRYPLIARGRNWAEREKVEKTELFAQEFAWVCDVDGAAPLDPWIIGEIGHNTILAFGAINDETWTPTGIVPPGVLATPLFVQSSNDAAGARALIQVINGERRIARWPKATGGRLLVTSHYYNHRLVDLGLQVRKKTKEHYILEYSER